MMLGVRKLHTRTTRRKSSSVSPEKEQRFFEWRRENAAALDGQFKAGEKSEKRREERRQELKMPEVQTTKPERRRAQTAGPESSRNAFESPKSEDGRRRSSRSGAVFAAPPPAERDDEAGGTARVASRSEDADGGDGGGGAYAAARAAFWGEAAGAEADYAREVAEHRERQRQRQRLQKEAAARVADARERDRRDKERRAEEDMRSAEERRRARKEASRAKRRDMRDDDPAADSDPPKGPKGPMGPKGPKGRGRPPSSLDALAAATGPICYDKVPFLDTGASWAALGLASSAPHAARKAAARRALLQWHSDKFHARFGDRVTQGGDGERVAAKITETTRFLQGLLQSLGDGA